MITTNSFSIALPIFILLVAGSPAFAQQAVPRFEVGAQFSLLSLNQPSLLVIHPIDPGFVGFAPAAVRRNEPGFGGRFTYNLTHSIAFEAEANLFPRSKFDGSSRSESFGRGPSGRVFQGQFGVKAGKRFRRVGIFGKARPGFVGFTKVTKLLGTSNINNPAPFPPFTVGRFGIGRELYFSTDLGAVVEYYHSRRIFARFDLGDTIIRYGSFYGSGASLSRAIIVRPPETKNSLQFSAGVGFRF
jgi:hypothetical protein